LVKSNLLYEITNNNSRTPDCFRAWCPRVTRERAWDTIISHGGSSVGYYSISRCIAKSWIWVKYRKKSHYHVVQMLFFHWTIWTWGIIFDKITVSIHFINTLKTLNIVLSNVQRMSVALRVKLINILNYEMFDTIKLKHFFPSLTITKKVFVVIFGTLTNQTLDKPIESRPFMQYLISFGVGYFASCELRAASCDCELRAASCESLASLWIRLWKYINMDDMEGKVGGFFVS
jgi:hypothetical protein